MPRELETIPHTIPTSILAGLAPWRTFGIAAAEASSAPDDERAFRSLLERALEATGAERAFLVVGRREAGHLEPLVLARVSRRADGRDEPSRTVFQRALAAPRPLVCPSGAADPRLADALSVRALRLTAVVAAPVPRQDGAAAAIVLDSATTSLSGAETAELLAGFAALAALVCKPASSAGVGERTAVPSASGECLVGRSPTFQAALRRARQVAVTSLPVLIEGESGTGKETLARLIHDASQRRGGPFVALNCAAVPETLIEAELFGAVRGAFTGAERDRTGLLRAAHGGTLFLDEVGDMPLTMQAKLLRVLQDGRVRAVGAERETDVDARIVAATHRDLPVLAEAGRFRHDLYWRLAVLALRLPPLRERPEDLAALASHLIGRLARRHGLPDAHLTASALDRLRSHAWPGNVRELEAVLARAILAQGGGALPARALELSPVPLGSDHSDGTRLEVSMIREALAAATGVAEAARRIGWSRQKLYRRMEALRIAPRRVTLRSECRAEPPERDPR